MQIFCAIIQAYYLKEKINIFIFIETNYKDNKILFPMLKNIDDIYKTNNKVNIELDINPIRM